MQENPNKSNYQTFAKEYVQNTRDAHSLLQKELTVNHSEQALLKQRIDVMREFLGDLPASDPQYSMIAAQIKMDAIELDELKARSIALLQKLEEI